MKILNWLKKYGPVFGLLLLGLGVSAFAWTFHHRQLSNAKTAAEAAEMRLKGQIVAVQEDNRKLVGSLGVMMEKNRLLAEAVADAKAAAPDSKMEGAATLQTVPVKVQRVPRADPPSTPGPPPLPPCASNHYAPDGTGSFYCAEDPAKGKDPDDKKPVCVLASDDSVSMSVDQVVLKTGEGNTLLAGTAAVWRETPPRAKLAEGKFSAALSLVETAKAPATPRWGAEGGVYCLSRTGCGPEVGLLLPPWRFLGMAWEGRGVAYGGADWGVGASVGARF